MEVILTFEKNGTIWTIKRHRKMKAGSEGNNVFLYKNNDFSKSLALDSVANTNKEIVKIIGIPYELFVRIVAFSAENIPFFKLPVRHASAPNQTDIIEELFDLKTLSEKAELLKKKIKDTDGLLQSHIHLANVAETELQRHTTLVDAARKRVVTWELKHTKDISDIHSRITAIDTTNFEKLATINILPLREERDKLEKAISKKRVDEKVKESEKNNAAKAIADAKEQLTHLKHAECPYCLQEFSNTKVKIKQCETLIEKNEDIYVNAKKFLEQVKNDLKTYKTKLGFVIEDINVYDQGVEDRNSYSLLESRLQELKNEINPHIENMIELEAIKIDTPDKSKIQEMQVQLTHEQFLLKLLTKKDSFVRKALLNKNIPFLNRRMQMYLKDIGLPHVVEFTHDMTANISLFGRPFVWGLMSNGQRSRINLALSFAFRDVMQSMHDHVNVCMLDEVLDIGLDEDGIQASARFLKRKARDEKLSLYIMSHRGEIDAAFERKIIVQLENGFSKIIE